MRKYDTYDVFYKMKNGEDLGITDTFRTYKEALRYYSSVERGDIHPDARKTYLEGVKGDVGTIIYRKDI